MPTDVTKINLTPVGVTGQSTAGIPTSTYQSVSATGDAGVSDGLSSGGVHGALTLTTANTALELKVGASRLTNRKSVTAVPNALCYWGYSNTVTTSTGTPIQNGQFYPWALDATDAAVQIWVISATAGAIVRVTESP